MRVAIISDIHSNLEALTKAMEVIDHHAVNEIICLGDIVGYGANPNECVDLVRQRCSAVIKGNHDEAVQNPGLTEHFSHDARAAIYWTREQMTERNLEYLLDLPYTHRMEDILFVHATPCEPEEWKYLLERAGAYEAFDCFSELICFIGHTHIPAIFSIGTRPAHVSRENRSIVNVGSIGQPRDRNTNLSFGIFDTGTWNYENIRCPYDMETAAWKILKTTLPSRLGQRLLMGM